MVRPWLWRSAHNDLHARIGRVVLACALLSVHMAERVRVLLRELVVLDQAGELVLPEHHRVLQFHTLAAATSRKSGTINGCTSLL